MEAEMTEQWQQQQQLVDINQFDKDQLNRILSNWKLTPATFAHRISRGEWIAAKHLQRIALMIAQKVVKGNARIILSMPPRHGKSQLVSIYTPAWLLEYIGKLNIILACYGSDLATGFTRKVRSIIQDPENKDLLRVRLGDLRQAEAFDTNLGGYMYGVGLGGTITGRGADVLLIDDYIKEIKEALSPSTREYIWNWYVTTALTRLEPNGSIIIIATRWHSDDLIGRLLRSEREEWDYIELPAIATKDDQLGRPEGTALFPERYPIERLLKLKKTLGTIHFQALFQQRPVDETMAVTNVEWLKIHPRLKPLPGRMRFARVWDLAATEGAGDYLVGTLCGYDITTEEFFILDVIREQLGPGQIEALVYKTAVADGRGVDIGIEQEPGSSGKILIEHFKTNVLQDFRVFPVLTGGKAKVIRAQPFLAACEAGQVKLLQDDPLAPKKWNRAFIDEFEVFPPASNDKHDDMIDTAAEAFTMLTGKKPLSATWTSAATKKKATAIIQPHEVEGSDPLLTIKGIQGSRPKGATWGSRKGVRFS
jgi:predicted phage terminase large subunit-like protein